VNGLLALPRYVISADTLGGGQLGGDIVSMLGHLVSDVRRAMLIPQPNEHDRVSDIRFNGIGRTGHPLLI
jgi:hypothetical protein